MAAYFNPKDPRVGALGDTLRQAVPVGAQSQKLSNQIAAASGELMQLNSAALDRQVA